MFQAWLGGLRLKFAINPLIPMSDQGRISPFNFSTIKQTSDENQYIYHLRDYYSIKYHIL